MIGAVMAVAFFAFIAGRNGFIVPKIAVVVAGAVVVYLRRARVPWAVWPLLAVLLASTANSIYFPWSLTGIPNQWALGFIPIVSYVLIAATPLGQERHPWLLCCAVLVAACAVGEQFFRDPVIPASLFAEGRSTTWEGSAVDAGAILAMAAPVAGWWLPVIAAGLWATGSRAAMLGAVVALTPGRARWKLIYLPLFFVPFFQPHPKTKDVIRVEIWKAAAASVREHPWLGSGPDTFMATFVRHRTPRLLQAGGPLYFQSQAHNDLLQAASTTGVLGLLAYLLLTAPLLRNPSLLALFVVLKFDAVAFEVLAAASLVAGTEWRRRR